MDPVGFEATQEAAIAPASAIGNENEPVAAGHEHARKRLRGEHMTTRAAGRKDYDSVRSRHSSSPARLRVSASSMPMPNAIASSDDPP